MIRHTLIILALVGLSACSSNPNAAAERQLLAAQVQGLIGRDAPRPDITAQVTPENLAATPTALIYVDFTELGLDAFLTPIAQNGPVRTWVSGDATTMALSDGLLTNTAGLGEDLVSVDLSQVKQALAGQRNQATRVHRYYNGEFQHVISAFVCDYTRQSNVAVSTLATRFSATQVTETCSGPEGAAFSNVYWIDSGQTIRRSQQWVSSLIGNVDIHLLKDQ